MIESLLGAGGMGEVWKGRDTRLDRVVALKFTQAQFTGRFEREARSVAALNHPNIAQLYDVGESYIVMEFVDGEPIRKPESRRKLLDIAVQIAGGLAGAHAAGTVHRDLKPDNILLTRDGRVKILDFGLARQHAAAAPDDATRTIAITDPGTVLGTVAYMSPEQARGQELDARSDQFALGLILYELAAGKRAFQRASAAETMTAIIREEPEPLPQDVFPPLRWTIERCLAKDPADRYASTRDLFVDLRAMRERFSESASVSPAAAPPKRNSRVWMAVAAVLAVALTLELARRMAIPSTPQFRFMPFAVEGLDEDGPVWSPDGRSLAYKASFGSERYLMVKGADGNSAPIRLARGEYFNSLSWSGDGERIYYETTRQGILTVMSVARAGGDPVPVPFDPQPRFQSPVMSPDGKTLAMVGRAPADGKPARRIWLSSPPGAAPVAIGPEMDCCNPGVNLAWSPDSTRILARISSDTDSLRLWLVTLQGGAKHFLPVPNIISPSFSWLDSRHVVIAPIAMPFSGGDTGLFLLDTASEKLSSLLPSEATLMSPSVSPDRKRIAYVRGGAGLGVHEIPLDGRPQAPFLPAHAEQHSVMWSPQRNEFAFVRNQRLTVRDREGTTERVLASGRDFPSATGPNVFITNPEFSPDGQRIAYTCSGCDAAGLSIWISPVSGGAPARLTAVGEGGSSPSWSPDGKWIVYSRLASPAALQKIRVGSGEKPVPIREPWCRLAAWSPSRDEILCADNSGTVLLSPDGKQTRDLGARVSAAAWSPDGKSIYAIRIDGGPEHLYRVDPVTAKWEQLADLPPGFRSVGFWGGIARLSPSPDGKSIAVSVLVYDGDIYVLEGYQPPRTFWQKLWPFPR